MVAADHKHSLMDSASLAIVMAPNFVRSLQSGGGGGGEGAGLKEYTGNTKGKCLPLELYVFHAPPTSLSVWVTCLCVKSMCTYIDCVCLHNTV